VNIVGKILSKEVENSNLELMGNVDSFEHLPQIPEHMNTPWITKGPSRQTRRQK
jgi:hypothetical protein